MENPPLAKLELVALRCWKIGLVCPSGKPMGEARWLAAKGQEGQEAAKVAGECAHVIAFPLDPRQLDPELFAAAYSDSNVDHLVCRGFHFWPRGVIWAPPCLRGARWSLTAQTN